MAAYLFMDDQRLLVREGLKRVIGEPELLEDTVFHTTGGSASHAGCKVWQAPDGRWHMFYQEFLRSEGMTENDSVILAAESTDGLHFTPRNDACTSHVCNPVFANQILSERKVEIGSFIDTHQSPGKLKLLISESGDNCVYSKIYESDDGIHWTLSPHRWHEAGTEPLAGVLYSEELQEYVLLCRPLWGIRRVCESRTKDFVHFSKPEPVLQVDALDEPLAETYGMYGFRYKDMYVGFLTMYQPTPCDTWKYWGGTIEPQLTYSFDGAHWQRSLRTPLINRCSWYSGMLFASDMRQDANDGSILIYASGTTGEHGQFKEDGGQMGVFRLREDGFVALQADGKGRLRTRETMLKGSFDINLKAQKATCGLFTERGEPIPGFTHDDCEPFSGDCTHWKPVFQSSLETLKDRIVTIEIKLENGELYGINGDFIKMMNSQVWQYNRYGWMPSV